MSADACLLEAVAAVPAGRWGVAVSGGADSVALLRLATAEPHLALHVVHLDHELRGDESSTDAIFVRQLAEGLRVPATIARRSLIEAGERASPPQMSNPSARYRAARLALCRRVVTEQQLDGVLLAHHADDQAETVLLRMLRGSGYGGMTGMAGDASVRGVRLFRPLLRVRQRQLRDFLNGLRQPWREDSSNASAAYARNRVRLLISDNDVLVVDLLALADRCTELNNWVRRTVPALPAEFDAKKLADLPEVLARAAASDWLHRSGVPWDDLTATHVTAVITMSRDLASPPRHAAPAGVNIHRRQGAIGASGR